ncbi:hypothetical protein NEAUS03_1418 [Nematocida ausubeli]|nr:hypothetical protein NEAUS03_1418 [Nematocida ausubeli]
MAQSEIPSKATTQTKNSTSDCRDMIMKSILAGKKLLKKSEKTWPNSVARNGPVQETKIENKKSARSEEGQGVCAMSRIIGILGRDRKNWQYISEQPIFPKNTENRIVDKRRPGLKKKYITYVKYTERPDTHTSRQKESELCAICLNKYISINICGILKCNHIFHKTCINSYITVAGHCPICRRDIISGVIN